jgi:vacuolar iron transporter family protein
MKPTDEQIALLKQFQKQEITGYYVYLNLAKKQKNSANAKILNSIAEDELQHYEVFKSITGE